MLSQIINIKVVDSLLIQGYFSSTIDYKSNKEIQSNVKPIRNDTTSKRGEILYMATLTKTKKSIWAIAALPLALSSALNAAEQSDEASAEEQGIDRVIVISEKRISNLQETPIAVSVFNTDKLAQQDIEEAADIQFAIPNAMFTDRGTFNIRGVGNSAIGSSAESGAGVHVNGIYLTVPNTQNEYYDLQSIEVLRGPQGTLYGRNTTAGVINIITQKPTDEFEGFLTVEVGNYDSIRTVGAINFPITDNVLQRFAFNTVERDGFTENVATGNDIDGRDQFSIRSTTHFEFSDNFEGTLFAQYFEEDSNRSNRRSVRCTADTTLGCSATEAGNEYPFSHYTDGNLLAVLGASAAIVRPNFYNTNLDGSPRINPSDPRKVNLDNEPIAKAEELTASLELNYNTDNGVFTSITSFHDTEGSGQRDYDNANGSDAFFVPVTYAFNDETVLQNTTDFQPIQLTVFESEQRSQELRFVSELDGNINYTAGLYWLNYKRDGRVATYHPYLSLLASALSLPLEYHDFDTLTPELETTSSAVFGELYYDINEKLKLTAGIRYSNEDKKQRSQTVSPLSFLTPGFDPTAFEELQQDWQETTGKLGLSYKADLDATEETLFFGTLAKGYKAGGLNPGGSTNPTFDAEYINSIEFGAKNTFIGRKLQANVTVFHYNYDGLQLGALETNGTGAAITDNTDAKVTGAEFEFVAAPIDGFLANLNFSFLDTEVTGQIDTADSSQGSSAGLVDIKGNSLPYAPEKSIQLGLQYTHLVFDGWELTYRAQTYWQDEFFARVYNSETDKLSSWQQTDFSIALADIYGDWEIEAFVKNIDNDDSVTGLTVENSLAGRFRLPAVLDPRQSGVRVSYRFD